MEVKMIMCPHCENYYNAEKQAVCPVCGKAAAENIGETIPVGPTDTPGTKGNETEGAPINGSDPVVGWLVCIEGPMRGMDFRIYGGYNYIGRESGEIIIQGDNQISREKHAVVSYYAKRHTYYVGPAEGRNIIELNDEPVFNASEMKSFDVITVGSTKLMLITLCGEHFSWTEGVKHD